MYIVQENIVQENIMDDIKTTSCTNVHCIAYILPMYSVQCTMYNVHEYTVQCTLYTIRVYEYTPYTPYTHECRTQHCDISVHCTLYNV